MFPEPISQSSFQNLSSIRIVKTCSVTLLALGFLNLIAGVYILATQPPATFSRNAIPFNAASGGGGYVLGMGSLVTLLAACLVHLLPKEPLVPIQDEKTVANNKIVPEIVHAPYSTNNPIEEYMKKTVIFSHSKNYTPVHIEGISHISSDQLQLEIKKNPYDIGFIFQRYDDRVEDFINLEHWVKGLQEMYQLKTVVFIAYSKEDAKTKFKNCKKYLCNLNIYFLELTIKSTLNLNESFNKDALSSFLREVVMVAKNAPDTLQAMLNNTEPGRFSVL